MDYSFIYIMNLFAIETFSLIRVNAQLEVATEPYIMNQLLEEKKRLT